MALRALHGAGLAHGNLKPCSILIHPGTGQVKLVTQPLSYTSRQCQRDYDFRFDSFPYWLNAKLAKQVTLKYVILEDLDQRNEGAKADIYALGCLAFDLTKSDSDWSNEYLREEDDHSMLRIIAQQGHHLRRPMR